MVNALQRLILVDEGSKGQLSDIVEKLIIRQGQVEYPSVEVQAETLKP